MGRNIAFIGSMGNVGTSMIATACAHELSRCRFRVLLVYASSQPGDDYVDDNTGVGLDDLRRKRVISQEEVKALIINDTFRFDYIKSIREITQIKYFDVGIIGAVSEVLAREYDYILIDGGCDIQYPLTVSSLIAANKRFFITTGNMKALRRLRYMMDSLLVPKGLYAGSHIVENKYDKNEASIASPYQIEQRLGLPCFEIPYVKGGARAETDHKTLLGRSGFDKAIRSITTEIVKFGGGRNEREGVLHR